MPTFSKNTSDFQMNSPLAKKVNKKKSLPGIDSKSPKSIQTPIKKYKKAAAAKNYKAGYYN
tara:strand:- start:911 stop:1093 length:183 start_codon:yes stop_codon:yes gene_type:complete